MPEAIISAMFSSIAELHIYAVDSDNTGGNHCKLLSMSQLDTFALWFAYSFVLKSIFLVESRDIST